jgi:hypothetical protein
MHTAKIATSSSQAALPHAAPPQAVPMLDVCRENSRLANELNAAMAEVARSGAFVHGPACHKFEAARNTRLVALRAATRCYSCC